jgi:hypothetical protein
MQPTNRRPRRDDDRRAWLPLAAVGALTTVVFLAAFLVFHHDDDAGTASGTLPATFPALTTVPSTVAPPTTPAPATTPPPAAANPPAVAPPRPAISNTTTTSVSGNPRQALRDLGDQRAASTVSDIATIGSDLYAMLIIGGNGDVVRWDGRQWIQETTANPPGVINAVQVIDVTGDGTKDFVVGLAGPNQAGGVYSRQTFQFQFLPFNTTTGRKEFIDHLQVDSGQLQSPFIDATGTRTLTWTWTGRMFETR